jgi:hypothetical protein
MDDPFARPRSPCEQQLVCNALGRVLEVRWLGRQDSNLGMAVPKTAALPLGDAPSAPRISPQRAAP